jgi:hypothetical protein
MPRWVCLCAFEHNWSMQILVSGVNDSTVRRMTLCATAPRCDGGQLREKHEMRHTISDVGHTAGGISLHRDCLLFSEFWSSKFQGQGRVFLEIFKASMKNAIFWDVSPCGSCKSRYFGGSPVFTRNNLIPWRWRRHVPPKRRFLEDK